MGTVRHNAWLKPFHDGLVALGKPPTLALVAAVRKLLHAADSATKNCNPFTINLAQT